MENHRRIMRNSDTSCSTEERRNLETEVLEKSSLEEREFKVVVASHPLHTRGQLAAVSAEETTLLPAGRLQAALSVCARSPSSVLCFLKTIS